MIRAAAATAIGIATAPQDRQHNLLTMSDKTSHIVWTVLTDIMPN